MLIFTRKRGQRFMIGDEVEVTVLGMTGSQVRVGVEAPKSVTVHRREVYDRVQTENNNKKTVERKATVNE